MPFTAVIEMSALVDRQQFGGNRLVYLPKYVDPADPLFEQSDEQIRAVVRFRPAADVSRISGRPMCWGSACRASAGCWPSRR